MSSLATQETRPVHDANLLGLNYEAEAAALPYRGPILDVHTHLNDLEAARLFFRVADRFNVRKVWSMSPLEEVDALAAEFGDRVEFIAVPNYAAREQADTFTTDWLRRIEKFREKGARALKFWAAPRGRDFHPDALLIDSPIRREGMKLAKELGYTHFMVHIADPDTWFATAYKDASKYGTKREQYPPFERCMDDYPDVQWLCAHMGGSPEDLDFLQNLLDRHPNLVVDTAATKWMVRELSKHPDKLRDFCRKNRGRVLFGSDIVATTAANMVSAEADYELFASRYWALRMLLESAYDGASPIVDPDLHAVDPSLPEKSSPRLRGAKLPEDLLKSIYHDAPAAVYGPRG